MTSQRDARLVNLHPVGFVDSQTLEPTKEGLDAFELNLEPPFARMFLEAEAEPDYAWEILLLVAILQSNESVQDRSEMQYPPQEHVLRPIQHQLGDHLSLLNITANWLLAYAVMEESVWTYKYGLRMPAMLAISQRFDHLKVLWNTRGHGELCTTLHTDDKLRDIVLLSAIVRAYQCNVAGRVGEDRYRNVNFGHGHSMAQDYLKSGDSFLDRDWYPPYILYGRLRYEPKAHGEVDSQIIEMEMMSAIPRAVLERVFPSAAGVDHQIQ